MTEIINSLRGSGLYGINPASRLWKPLRIGKHVIQHRVALAPLTRVRCPNHVPTAMGQEYYAQRTDSNLLVTEATFIALEAAGMPSAPGIYNDDQITAWKKITNAVHAKGGIIYCQLWYHRSNLGRSAAPILAMNRMLKSLALELSPLKAAKSPSK